jgi:SAM-dependent methyltransferase
MDDHGRGHEDGTRASTSIRTGHDAADEWDGFYTGDGDDTPHWSGQPNPTLVTEAASLQPGRALDVGCGEGGDAVWLARRGWRVTAIDPSGVALERARAAARATGVEVTWIRAGLLDLPSGTGGYDLVTAHYPVLPRGDDDASTAALFGAVAPGGTLLLVHHDLAPTRAAEHGFDLAAHVTPSWLATQLDDHWELEVLETRERHDAHVPEHEHPSDIVLRARRR